VVIAIGLGIAALALLLFALATGTAWLFAARATLGVAQGMLSGAATASLAELVPAGDTRRAALLATLSQAGGSAAGVLLCGVLAQWAPAGGDDLPLVRAAAADRRGRGRSPWA
jgi:MFS family permease